QVSKYRVRSSRTSSGSLLSESEVNPTRSANSTETSRRSAAGAGAGSAGLVAWAVAPVPPPFSPEPHSPQNLAAGGLAEPQAGHARARRFPHSKQNLRPASFSLPHTLQRTLAPGARPVGSPRKG